MGKSYVLCWRIISSGDDCDDPVLMEATPALARRVGQALGNMSAVTGAQVLEAWAAGRSVRTRLSVYSPVPPSRVPDWLDPPPQA